MEKQFGLPDMLEMLIKTETEDYGGFLKWKVVCNQDFTQVTLTWDKQAKSRNSIPVPIHHDQAINNRYTGYGYKQRPMGQNCGPIPGYRKKTPSELRRDQERKRKFQQKYVCKRNKCGQDEPIHADAMTQCSPIVDNNSLVVLKKTDDLKCKVTTRSMVKQNTTDDVETPRDSSLLSDSPLMSPASVHSDSHSTLSDTEPPNMSSEEDIPVSESESDEGESDPVLPPGCYNNQCSYGDGRKTNIPVYDCTKCGTSVCQECYDEGIAHKGHHKYLKLVINND